MSGPTKAQMERVLLRYGRRIVEGNRRHRPSTSYEVFAYCRALKQVWNLAEKMALAAEKKGRR